MIASHVHDALGQVRRLRGLILDRRAFRGYSGPARILAGMVALTGAAVLAILRFRDLPGAHLAGWACVLAVALALNYGALLRWFLRDPDCAQRLANLRPAIDALPALATGAALSLALVVHRDFDLLFGTWMVCYGLAHIPYRQSLPFGNYLVGLGYVGAGAVCLLWPGLSFTNPWPMGLVFGVGEMTGGAILYLDRRRVLAAAAEPIHERP